MRLGHFPLVARASRYTGFRRWIIRTVPILATIMATLAISPSPAAASPVVQYCQYRATDFVFMRTGAGTNFSNPFQLVPGEIVWGGTDHTHFGTGYNWRHVSHWRGNYYVATNWLVRVSGGSCFLN